MNTLNLPGPVDPDDPDGNGSSGAPQNEAHGQDSRSHSDARRTAGGARQGSDGRQEGHSAGRNHRRRKSSRPKPHIPSRDEVLAFLFKLPQFVACMMISPAQSNAMVTAITAAFRYLPEQTSAGGGRLDPKSFQSALRDHPELLGLVEHLLSPEELEQYADDDPEDHDQNGGDGQDGNDGKFGDADVH